MRSPSLPRSSLPRSSFLTALLVLMVGCEPLGSSAISEGGLTVAKAASEDASPRGDATQATHATDAAPCDPIVPSHCALPYPNRYYLAPDVTRPTGLAVTLPEGAIPKDRTGSGFDVSDWEARLDGYNLAGPFLTHIPALDLEESGAPRHWDIESSLGEGSPTILINLETGALIPHWVELDASTANDNQRALFIWPAEVLDYGTPYAVALRGLKDSFGSPIAPSPAFQALRDGLATEDPALEGRRGAFEAIFTKLEAAGIERSDLTLAWDFVTASQETTTGWLLHMRDDALSRLPEGGPAYRIDEVLDAPKDEIFRQIDGRMRVPLYLTSPAPTARSEMALGSDGLPAFQGFTWVPFTVTIPRSVGDNPSPSLVMQYGHGMFGEREEITYGWARALMDEHRYIAAGADWWGMATEDVPSVVVTTFRDFSRFNTLTDRLLQGVLNHLVLTELLVGDFAEDPAMVVDGISVIDTDSLAYYGNSQGGILGGVFMALSQRITRGVIGVGGSPYAMMLYRSANFAPYGAILSGRYPNALDQALMIALAQALWDRAEPAGYLKVMTDEPLPGTPAHRLLFQTAIGDAQVPNLASDFYGRSVGATLLEAPARPIWGMEEGPGPLRTSGYVEFDHGAPPVPDGNIPPDSEEDTHELSRRVPEGQMQLDRFIRTGEIVNFCEGACDPD